MSHKAKNFCQFTGELDEKLIEIVSENEVLYNTGHKYYKDLNVRDDVWVAVSSIVGRSVQDCKTRWRSLRDLYHRKKKDRKHGRKARSDWKYMESMKFLEKFTTEKKALVDDLSEEDDIDSKIDIKLEFDSEVPTTSTCSQNGEDQTEDPPPPPPLPPPPKRPRRESSDYAVYENSTILHLLREIRDLAREKNDPIVAFFDSMAKTVIRFPPAQAAEVKLKVCQIVTEMECKILEDNGEYPENLQNFDG